MRKCVHLMNKYLKYNIAVGFLCFVLFCCVYLYDFVFSLLFIMFTI